MTSYIRCDASDLKTADPTSHTQIGPAWKQIIHIEVAFPRQYQLREYLDHFVEYLLDS